MPNAGRHLRLSFVGHIHRVSVAGAVLLVSGLVSVALATRTFGADRPTSASSPRLLAAAGTPSASNPGLKLVRAGGYLLTLHVTPNRAPNAVRVRVAITRRGEPVQAAHVRLTVTMLDMPMAGISRTLQQTGPGRWDSGIGNLAFGMTGRWGLRLEVTPDHARRFTIGVVDRVSA